VCSSDPFNDLANQRKENRQVGQGTTQERSRTEQSPPSSFGGFSTALAAVLFFDFDPALSVQGVVSPDAIL
jgi:hypothetical protein